MSSHTNQENDQSMQQTVTNSLAKCEEETVGGGSFPMSNHFNGGISAPQMSTIIKSDSQKNPEVQREENIAGDPLYESHPFRNQILDNTQDQPSIQGSISNMVRNQVQPTAMEPPNGRINETMRDQVQNSLVVTQQQMSSTSLNHKPNQKLPENLKVKLQMFGEQVEMIRNVPIRYSVGDENQILVQPILNYIKYMGKQLVNKNIHYYSFEDEARCFLGIEGRSINNSTTIDFAELESKNGQYVLSLYASPVADENLLPKKNNQTVKNDQVKQEDNNMGGSKNGVQADPSQQNTIQLSLPNLAGSQVNREIAKIIDPIKRERATKVQMQQRISENVKINQQSEESRDHSSIMKNLESVQEPKQNGENEPQELMEAGIYGKSSKGSKNSNNGHSDSGDNMEEQEEDASYESQQDNDSDDSPYNRKKGRKSSNLMKARNGGVNGLRGDKKLNNAQSSMGTKPFSGTSQRSATNAAQNAGAQYNLQTNKTYIHTGPINDDQGKKRTKERTITEIIEKVSTWRKLYNGVMIPNKTTGEVQLQRWSLEDAAKKVDVSKKSLDDYLLQLRFGKKFGFNFEAHRDSKVGVLRSFVKAQKDKLKKQNGNQKVSSKSPLKDE